jgi:hypothetical protein
MKKKPTGKKPQKPKPTLKWQTGDYSRHAEFKFILPYQFLLLCRLMEVTPEEVVLDFTENLACGSKEREGRDKAKEHLIDYFIAHGYGQQHYTEEDLRRIFREMDAVGLLFPKNAKAVMFHRYIQWRDKHYSYWFKQWFRKPRRKLPKGEAI